MSSRIGHPLGPAVYRVFTLPDRRQLLELLDDVPRGLECRSTVRVCRRDGHADLAEIQRPHAMLHDDVYGAPALGSLADDCRQLPFGHLGVSGVVQAGNRRSVIHLAHGTDEQHGRAILVARYFPEESAAVDGPPDDRGPHQPPATGGMIATSSVGPTRRSSAA